MTRPSSVLFVGATGSVGRLAVAEALRQGYHVRALVRGASHAGLLQGAELFEGDLTSVESLSRALEGIDGIVFTMGSHVSAATIEQVDYGAVRNALIALDGRKVRIALMTAIGITNMDSSYNRRYQAHDWKRRSEWLVRASGNEYTIVRPGWFDYGSPDERRLVFLQGDGRRTGSPSDGAVSRDQIARTLVDALGCGDAVGKTLELVAERGEEQADLTPLFAALERDTPGNLDGVRDEDNFPPSDQPQRVLTDLRRIRAMNA
ncbi:NAD-dependent dehydratase [Bifidobacterium tissieri]|uniref:NAD-dependent dehydratase n=1 Tax=Bifidobacterium tissieri TaxID=1630162 RepID=A0A261F924_9BIFI|nr:MULTISPECIES: SDR family oxidoreductase [Bifidobacterium]OZG55545.1 NAD-dependent dehydratase [Bifidobacterium tissieri]TPF96969.1 NAD-dependent dehydratase [Bifidobacterium sp. UTCIF-39]